jgi:hypothetical protein
MRQRSTKWAARIAAAGVAAASVPLFFAGPANAATATCTGPTSVFDVMSNGSLWLYQNTAPTTGGATWTNIHQIGTGWAGRTLAGANGDVFSIAPNGDLRYFHWNFATNNWDNNANYVTAGTGFQAYLTGALAKKITVDASGTIYAVDATGVLRAYSVDPTTHKLTNNAGTVVDQGWGGYTRIFSSGPGVLYAVAGNGTLVRSRLDAKAQEFTEYATAIGTDWDKVFNVWSPGADILYVTDAQGTLSWFKYNDDTHQWDNGASGKVIGSGWNNVADASSTTSTCSVPQPGAVAPVAPTAAAATDPLGLGSLTPGDQKPFYFYNSSGKLMFTQDATATTLSTPAQIGTRMYSSPVTVANVKDGSIGVGALDGNGTVYFGRGDNTTASYDLSPAGGSFKALAATSVNNEAQLFGIDSNGQLWTAADADTNGDLTAWHNLTPGLTGTNPRLAGPLSVGTEGGNTVYGVSRLSDGTIGYFTETNGVLGTPTELPNSATLSGAVVTDKSAAPAVFAVGADGSDNMSDGTTWTALPALPNGRKATAVTSAVAAAGSIAVAVEADNGQVYVANQTSATEWAVWKKLNLGTGVSATNMPKLYSSNGSGVDLAFNGSDGKIYHFTAPAPSTGNPAVWTGKGHSFPS